MQGRGGTTETLAVAWLPCSDPLLHHTWVVKLLTVSSSRKRRNIAATRSEFPTSEKYSCLVLQLVPAKPATHLLPPTRMCFRLREWGSLDGQHAETRHSSNVPLAWQQLRRHGRLRAEEQDTGDAQRRRRRPQTSGGGTQTGQLSRAKCSLQAGG